MGESELSTANHLQDIREESRDEQKIWDDTNNDKLGRLVYNLKVYDHHLILHTKNTGYWMTTRGNKATGTVLAAKEFSDFLCARYNVILPNLKKV